MKTIQMNMHSAAITEEIVERPKDDKAKEWSPAHRLSVLI